MRENRPPYKIFGYSSNFSQDFQQSEGIESIYERIDVIHGENCQRLLKCRCTSLAECKRLDEERLQKIRQSHKGRNQRRRAAKIERLQQQQQQERDYWDPTMEDLAV